MQGWKNNNDPWSPLPETNMKCLSNESDKETASSTNAFPSNAVLKSELPSNPLHQMIDSQRYIEILEKKLEKLKSRRKEPTSKDIITSLALFEEDQMQRYINTDEYKCMDEMYELDSTHSSSSFLKRKLHPEQQALNAEELLELIKADVVATSHEEQESSDNILTTKSLSDAPSLKQINGTEESENWANFEEMNQVINSGSSKIDETK